MNREYAELIIKKLLECGVAEFYVCAGARNFPLVETVLNIQSAQQIVFNHFEERSAAFYALGRIKSLNKPIAVITTSGTAVGELLPATMEAYYSGLPLIIITADRPRSYRGTGAPQAAEQKNIFGPYVSTCFDLETDDELTKFTQMNVDLTQPLHINVCFGMPLQSGVIHPLEMPRLNNQTKDNISFDPFVLNKLKKFLQNAKNVVVIVSKIKIEYKSCVIKFLKKVNFPVYLESISNLRESKELAHLRINCPDQIWKNAQESNYHIDSVIKIGGTPTHRFWRDLDETHKDIKVLSIHDLPFSGMPNAEHITTHFGVLFNLSIKLKFKKNHNQNKKYFLKNDKISFNHLKKTFKSEDKSEILFVHQLSKKIDSGSRVYLGNSMPIRHWDMAATYKNKNLFLEASRGLNGIDGQISTFLGFADESCTNWGIFGDLTTLYDMAGLWMLFQRPNLSLRIVVINNFGGRIFKNVLSGKEGEFCQNTHRINFEHLAKIWCITYIKIRHCTKRLNTLPPGKYLIEFIDKF